MTRGSDAACSNQTTRPVRQIMVIELNTLFAINPPGWRLSNSLLSASLSLSAAAVAFSSSSFIWSSLAASDEMDPDDCLLLLRRKEENARMTNGHSYSRTLVLHEMSTALEFMLDQTMSSNRLSQPAVSRSSCA